MILYYSKACFYLIKLLIPVLQNLINYVIKFQKPILICRKGEFRNFLEESVPLLDEHYWPTPWCLESRLQTVIGSVLRTRLLPAVNYRRYVSNEMYKDYN